MSYLDTDIEYRSEQNCPNSYAYAYDEPSGTALWYCDANKAVGECHCFLILEGHS